ncbi:MAG: amylo-alpha-1,6-glucosidase [Candidatus Latescibacterota bacterium]
MERTEFIHCTLLSSICKVMILLLLPALVLACASGDAGNLSAGRSGRISGGMPGNALTDANESEIIIKEWSLAILAGAWREFIYTNKVATHFSGEAVRGHSRSYHGLFCSMHEYLDSWELCVNGEMLDTGAIGEARVYPHTIYRAYPASNIAEEIFLPDEFNELFVRFTGVETGEHELMPWIDMRYIWDTPKPDYRIFWEKKNNILLVSRMDNPFPKGQPRWLGITANVPLEYAAGERFRPASYPKDAARRAMAETFPFAPGRLTFKWTGGKGKPISFAFILGTTDSEVVARAKMLSASFDKTVNALKQAKLDRIYEQQKKLDISNKNSERDQALRWALVSMDNLVMKQRGRGIYAGFHWFPNYWGRDSFICLPGACLTTKKYDVSREIILSFVEHQQTDPASDRLGRFPNIVNPENLQYAGVDGTWWLVRAAWKHIVTTGDEKVLAEAFPHIKLAIEGALEKTVDEYGFLKHGNGETWMDAGGEANPYSPRGDRAVEVQALFHHGLLAGASWARTLASVPGGAFANIKALRGKMDLAELEALAVTWEQHAAKLRGNFAKYFWNEKDNYLFDHLNVDGSSDLQIRPNAVLALWVSLDAKDLAAREVQWEGGGLLQTIAPQNWQELIPIARAQAIVQTAMKTVVLPQGVTSLDPKDPAFHPYHLNLNSYYYDEAYHNGDVWEWLTGPMVTCMRAVGEDEAAGKLLEPLVNEILKQGCVGSLREIQDGVYTEGKEEFGGATSQAWSLAEFIRVCLEK